MTYQVASEMANGEAVKTIMGMIVRYAVAAEMFLLFLCMGGEFVCGSFRELA